LRAPLVNRTRLQLRSSTAHPQSILANRKRSNQWPEEFSAVGFVLSLLLAGQAQAARLIVTIEGTRDADGYLYVVLFAKPDGFPDGDYSVQHIKLKAAPKPLTVVFDDLAPGAYAVGAYHDENNNGRLDTDFIGGSYRISG
jgi:uncharacterized protein (DUF2141 family)